MNVIKILLLALLTALTTYAASAQDTLSTADKMEISYTAKLMIKELESLLNVLSNENITLTQTKILISNSHSSESPNQLFKDAQVVIEDDINPQHRITQNAVDVSADRYLSDLDIFYSKSPEPTIAFSNIKASSVEKKDYVYVRVFFESHFQNPHKEIKVPYKPAQRIAEVRAEKEGNQWKTRIVSITFHDPEEEFKEADYQLSSAQISSDLMAIEDNDSTMDVDDRVRQIEARALEIEQEYLNKFEQEIQDRKERYEKEKAATFKSLITRGDKAFEEEDYKNALSAYEEAQAVDPYQVSLLKKINQVKQVMDDRIRMEEAQFQAAVKMGNIFAQIRNYTKAISHLRSADKIRPGIDSITQKIKSLDQRQIYLADLLAKFPDTDPQEGVKVYTKEMKRVGEDADLLYARGLCYKAMGKEKQAISDFTDAIKEYPDYRDAYISRGQIYEGQMEQAKAITDYGFAITIYRKDAPLLVKRAKLHLATNQVDKAIKDYGEAIELQPKLVSLYMQRGKILHNHQQATKAVNDFSQVVRLTPDDPNGWYFRGLSYLDLDEVSAAADDFEQARLHGLDQSARDHIEVIAQKFYNEGMNTYNSRNLETAVIWFTKAVQVLPNYAEAWYARGDAHYASKLLQKAVNDYTKASQLDKNMYRAYYQRGLAHYGLGQKEEAINDFDHTLRIKPDFYAAYQKSGDTNAELKKFAEALQAYDQLVLRQPDMAIVHFKAGKIRTELRQFSPAIRNLTTAIKNQKRYPEAYYYRGLAFVGTKNDGSAKKDFSSALKENERYAEAYFELGNIYFRAEKYKKAIPLYDEAIKYKKPYAEAHLQKAEALYGMGEFGFALPQFDEVLKLNADLIQPEHQIKRSFCYLHNRNIADARNELKAVSDPDPKQKADIAYADACADLIEGKMDQALEKLEVALREGRYPTSRLKKDPLLKPLQKNSKFRSLVSRYGK